MAARYDMIAEPPPALELVAMQPAAQRDLARLRTGRLALRDNRYLLRHAPTAPSRCIGQDFQAKETVKCLSVASAAAEDAPTASFDKKYFTDGGDVVAVEGSPTGGGVNPTPMGALVLPRTPGVLGNHN